MSVAKYLIVLAVCTVLCWCSFVFILLFLSPAAGWFVILFFYLSLGFSLIGTFSILGFLIRSTFKKEELAHQQINIVSRQALILSVLIIAILILQSQRYLKWWVLLILVLMTSVAGLFLTTHAHNK
jgi:hypothetical protein